MANTESIGDRLRRLREAAGLTQAELADKAGVSRPSVNEIETGITAKPRRGTLSKLAAALKMRVEQLQPEAPAAPEQAAPALPQMRVARDTPSSDREMADFYKEQLERVERQAEAREVYWQERFAELLKKPSGNLYAAEPAADYVTTSASPIGPRFDRAGAVAMWPAGVPAEVTPLRRAN